MTREPSHAYANVAVDPTAARLSPGAPPRRPFARRPIGSRRRVLECGPPRRGGGGMARDPPRSQLRARAVGAAPGLRALTRCQRARRPQTPRRPSDTSDTSEAPDTGLRFLGGIRYGHAV